MVHSVREDFPFFRQEGAAVFLDTAASAQKPKCVLDTIYDIYSHSYANVHRANYMLSDVLTAKFESVRALVAEFIGARIPAEIVFCRNATEAINLVASAYGECFIKKGQEIVISDLEHHSNILPWQRLCERIDARLRVCPYNAMIFDDKTAMVAVTHMSNVTGAVLPVEDIVREAHRVGAKVLVDSCQGAVHLDVDVQQIDCDFLVCSAHKLYGPGGVGILYGKYNLLEAMSVYQVGGGMVHSVFYDHSVFQSTPNKFEAGTQPIVEVVAFGEAIRYLAQLDMHQLRQDEEHLRKVMLKGIQELDGYQVLHSHGLEHSGMVSFWHESISGADIGILLDQMGVAVRAGHHCAQPFLASIGMSSVVRASLGIYSNLQDVHKLLDSLIRVKKIVDA